jgi:hypothetical protein
LKKTENQPTEWKKRNSLVEQRSGKKRNTRAKDHNKVLHIFSREGGFMVNVTISVPQDLKDLLDKHPEMNWSEVARQAWKKKAEQLELLDKITASSKATDKDINELAKAIKKGIEKWHDEQP